MGVLSRARARLRRIRGAPPTVPPAGPRVSSPRPDRGPSPGLARLADVDQIRAAVRVNRRVLLVNHWATWCEGCVDELPVLVDLVGRLGDRVEAVGVGWESFMEGSVADVERVARDLGLTWPTLVFDGEPPELFAALGLTVHQIPQTFLICPERGVLAHHVGVVDADLASRWLDLLVGGGDWPASTA